MTTDLTESFTMTVIASFVALAQGVGGCLRSG
jgi:hypothetical protein